MSDSIIARAAKQGFRRATVAAYLGLMPGPMPRYAADVPWAYRAAKRAPGHLYPGMQLIASIPAYVLFGAEYV